MKKLSKMLLLLIAMFSILIFLNTNTKKAYASSTYPTKAVVVSDVTISGGGRTAKYNQLDLYMTSSAAKAYAAKMANSSYSSLVGWFASGFIPGIGPYVTAFGFGLNLGTHQNVNFILSAAKKYSKVHISVGNGMILSATKWDGKASSVTPVKSSTSKRSYGNITTTTKVHIDKRVLKA
ncbi:MAG: hypothetical protein FWH31_06600 [Streptococcaceae bacterium]|nr:hypothetical protein [Streptococcaceae bacterium]